MSLRQEEDRVAVYCVGSPLQLICADEARARLGCARNILIIRDTNDARQIHNDQMEKLVQAGSWSETFFFPQYPGPEITALRRISLEARRLALHIGPGSIFVLGGFSVLRSQVLRSHLKPRRTIVIDDGTSTLTHLSDYYSLDKRSPGFIDSVVSARGPKAWLKRRLLSLDARVLSEPIELLTGFDVGRVQIGSTVVHQHRFEELKRLRSGRVVNDQHVFYFGSPLSERGILSMQVEVRVIKKIADYYRKARLRFKYISHRDDSEIKIKELSGSGVDVLSLGAPAEVFFASSPEIPANVASTVSTALHNVCCIVDGLNATAFPVTALVGEADRKAHERVTDQYCKLGIRINILPYAVDSLKPA